MLIRCGPAGRGPAGVPRNAGPGDLVFIDDHGHVGSYAGDGMMWDARCAGEDVSRRRIYSSTFAVVRVA